MAVIEADIDRLSRAETSVLDSIHSHEDFVKATKGLVDKMAADWSGTDYIQYKFQWERITGAGSNIAVTLEALKEYKELLYFVMKEYRGAVIRARQRFAEIAGHDINVFVKDFRMDTQKMRNHAQTIKDLIKGVQSVKNQVNLLKIGSYASLQFLGEEEKGRLQKINKLLNSGNLETAVSKLTKVKNALNDTADDFDKAERLIQKQEEKFTQYLNSTPYGTDYSVIIEDIASKLYLTSAEFLASGFIETGPDGSFKDYNWEAINEILKNPDNMTDEQATALALLYLRMDDENKQTFYLYCFEQVNDVESGAHWQAKPGLEKIISSAQTIVTLNALYALEAGKISPQEYAQMLGDSEEFQGMTGEEIKNEILRQITDNNLDQLLALTALQHVAQLSIVDKYGSINWTKDAVLISKKELSPECLEITFDHDNYTCTVTYKDRGAEGNYSEAKTDIIKATFPSLAEQEALRSQQYYLNSKFDYDLVDIISKNLANFIMGQVIPGLDAGILIMKDILAAEQDQAEAAAQISLADAATYAKIMKLDISIITAEPPQLSSAAVYPGVGTSNAIRFLNEAVTKKYLWTIVHMDNSTNNENVKYCDLARQYLNDHFGGEIKPSDLEDKWEEILTLYKLLPVAMQDEIKQYNGGDNDALFSAN